MLVFDFSFIKLFEKFSHNAQVKECLILITGLPPHATSADAVELSLQGNKETEKL